MTRLGVNIDHVATLRNQRDEGYPSIEKAAQIALESGADQITIHLREDRRHIRDEDLLVVKKVCQTQRKLLNLEVGTDISIAKIAGDLQPDWVCIVPEKREEKTTEGGLNLLSTSSFNRVVEVALIVLERSPQTKISLFIEAGEDIFNRVIEMGQKVPIHAVEIHTGEYARKYLHGEDFQTELKSFKESKKLYDQKGIGHHAGHGLTLESVSPLVEENLFEEYNIGHWIISESIFFGLGQVVGSLKEKIST